MFNRKVTFKESHLHGTPHKYYCHEKKRYIDLSTAKEISREHGGFWGTSYPYDYVYEIKMMHDIGATVLILEKDDKYYLVVKNCMQVLLQKDNIQEVDDVHIMECDTLDEAHYYAERQKKNWKPHHAHFSFWKNKAVLNG